MSNLHRTHDPAQNLIMRTLLAPTLFMLALLVLIAPALAKAAPADAEVVFTDSVGEGTVKKVEVRSRRGGEGVELTFVVKVAGADASPGLRLEWTDGVAWHSTDLDRSGKRRFVGRVSVAFADSVSFFLLGTDEGGRVEDVEYATLIDPAEIGEREEPPHHRPADDPDQG